MPEYFDNRPTKKPPQVNINKLATEVVLFRKRNQGTLKIEGITTLFIL